MLPWIMLGASILQNAQAKKQEREQALQSLMMNHARDLGANTAPLQAMQQNRAINNQPTMDYGMLANAIGSTVQSEGVNDRLAKEMASRGLMKGARPFDEESNDPAADYMAALDYKYRNGFGGLGG